MESIMATQIDTGYGIITIDDNANFSGNIAGVDLYGNVDATGTGSVYTNYRGDSGTYYFEGGQLVGNPWSGGGGGWEDMPINDLGSGRFGDSGGRDFGLGDLSRFGGDGADWLSTHTDWGVDLDGVRGGAGVELDFGWPFRLEGSADVGFDWNEREIGFELGGGLGLSDRFLDSLVDPEHLTEANFLREISGIAGDQLRNAVDNLGTNLGGFYYNTVENIGNLRDSIVNFHDNLFREFESGVDELFSF
jgi:hypothetical protein